MVSSSRLVLVAAVAATFAAAAPLGASAKTPAGGSVYGGVTPQGWPIVIEVNKKRTLVVRATIGLDLTCTPQGGFSTADFFTKLKIKKGKFGTQYGPLTIRNDDGTTSDFSGLVSGKVNKARTKVSGTWELKETDFDAAGKQVDTCDSGLVRWKAKQ